MTPEEIQQIATAVASLLQVKEKTKRLHPEDIQQIAETVVALLQPKEEPKDLSAKEKKQKDWEDRCRAHVNKHFKKKYTLKL